MRIQQISEVFLSQTKSNQGRIRIRIGLAPWIRIRTERQPVPSSGRASAGRRRLTGRDQTSNSPQGPTWADGNHSTSIQVSKR